MIFYEKNVQVIDISCYGYNVIIVIEVKII